MGSPTVPDAMISLGYSTRSVLLLPLIAVAACAEQGTDSLVTVTDSAGTSVVVNHATEGQVPLLFTADSVTLRLGVVEGEPAYTFSSVRDVKATPGGGVLVAEGQSRELRVFDGSGRHLRTLGGRGEGPGEFAALSGIAGTAGDTVWAWDARSQRLSTFLLGGELLETIPGDGDPYGRILELRRLADGTFIARSRWRARDGGSRESSELVLVRDTLVLRHLDPALRTMDTVAVLPSDEFMQRTTTAGSGSGVMVSAQLAPRPFGRSTPFTLGGTAVVVGINDSFEWSARSADGHVTTVSRVLGIERPLAPEAVDRLREYYLSFATTVEQRQRVSDLFEGHPLPETIPPFESIRVDPAGRVWVARYKVTPDDESTWYVFSSEGRLLGRASLPVGLSVHEIGRDFVLGVLRDELDVPFVVRVPLTPRSP